MKTILTVLLLTVASATSWGITITGTSTSRTVSGTPTVETTVLISAVADNRVTTAGTTSSATVNDKLVSRESAAETVTDYSLSTAWTSDPDLSATWSSSNDSVATVNTAGQVTHVADGNVRIRLSTAYGDYTEKLVLSTTPSNTVDKIIGYVSGSAGKEFYDTIRTLAEAGGDKNVFTSQTHTGTPSYTRNTSAWVAAIDWTGVSPWNSNGSNRKAGTAVTEKHLIHAWHSGYTPPSGTIRFILADNTIVDRQIVARAQVGTTDIGITELDTALPSGVKKYKVLPDDWADYFAVENLRGTLCVAFDQEEKALARQITRLVESTGPTSAYHTTTEGLPNDTDNDYGALTEVLVGGDSGNPLFLLLDDEPILLGCHFTAGGVPLLSNHITAINAAIDAMGSTGLTITEVDLSGYDAY